MMASDLISVDLRRAEHEIDRHHLQNPLMAHSFAKAAWHFLAQCEDIALFHAVHEAAEQIPYSRSEGDALIDNIIVHSKWPLLWISRACTPGGTIPSAYDDSTYEAAAHLSKLSMKYLSFESAFSYGTWGLATLTLEGNRIKTTGPVREDSRFDAYDRLATNFDRPVPEPGDGSFQTQLAESLRIGKDKFNYSLNPRIVSAGMELLSPIMENQFKLPSDWRLSSYTIGDFRQVAKVLSVLAYIHYQARAFAAMAGCIGLGYSNALLLMGTHEIIQRVRRYSGLPESVVAVILRDLTYGSRGQVSPDPALQPIIQLTASMIAIAPNLVLGSSMERNLTVLLNRVPEERAIYTSLSQTREAKLRNTIKAKLSNMSLRFWHGEISEWGSAREVDLIMISDDEHSCLLLELKAFIGPAEAREIKEKSEEILKGIVQVRDRRENMIRFPEGLYRHAHIGPEYTIGFAVASETSIGANYVQSSDVPVVNAAHMVAKLLQVKSLSDLMNWLQGRDYLPVEGIHYKSVETEDMIGRWTLEWYGLRELVSDYL